MTSVAYSWPEGVAPKNRIGRKDQLCGWCDGTGVLPCQFHYEVYHNKVLIFHDIPQHTSPSFLRRRHRRNCANQHQHLQLQHSAPPVNHHTKIPRQRLLKIASPLPHPISARSTFTIPPKTMSLTEIQVWSHICDHFQTSFVLELLALS